MNNHKYFDTISLGVIQNGKWFTFRQNEYILRTSCIWEEMHMENIVKGKKLMPEIAVGIIDIIVTIIDILVTTISIIQTTKIHKHQKSNRQAKG